jgi:hypothetical protein
MITSRKLAVAVVVVLAHVAAPLYEPIIDYFPSFIHAWTQSDRYAIALRFLDNGFDLFHPATFNYQTVDGITRVDFPINEYIVALLMKLFGSISPAIFRIYTISVSLAGLAYLYLLSKKITGSDLKALLVVVFVFFSPVYFYYQAGFLPSIPSIACLFAAYYYYVSYCESEERKQFILAVLLFLLAALMRFPDVIFLVATLAHVLIRQIGRRKIQFSEFLGFAFAFLVFAGYYLYNIHLGRVYGNMFLDAMMPARNFTELREVLSAMYHHWGLHYFTIAHYVLLLSAAGIFLFQLSRRRHSMPSLNGYWVQFLIAGCGALFYFILMARQFVAHDYYFLDSFFVPVILVLILSLKSVSGFYRFKRVPSVIIGILFLVFVSFACSAIQDERYTTGSWDRTEITRKNFLGTDSFLDKNGISRNAKILVIDAYTTNAPLILMQRKGYTVMGTTAKNISMTLAWAKWDYVAIQDEFIVSDVVHSYPLITSMLDRVCGNGRVSFFKRSKEFHSKSLSQFLGISPENILRSDENASAQRLDANTEYGITTVATGSLLANKTGIRALVNFDFRGGDLSGIRVVTSCGRYYQEFSLADYYKPCGQWQHGAFQFALPDPVPGDAEMRVYLWNSEKKELDYKNWSVIVYK